MFYLKSKHLRLYNKIKNTLKRRSGASLILVLGVMLFLLAIGISTMAAAFANAGYIMRQNDYNRVRLLHESIHENIMHSLQANTLPSGTGNPNSLGFQLAMAIFKVNDPTPQIPPLAPSVVTALQALFNDGAELGILFDGTSILGVNNHIGGRLITVQSITLSFPYQIVNINEAIPGIPDNYPSGSTGDNIITHMRQREPRTATVNASMEVRVEIVSGDRTITSIAVYEYTGGRLTDTPSGVRWDDPPPLPMVFVPVVTGLPGYPNEPGGYGTWSMVRYEIPNW